MPAGYLRVRYRIDGVLQDVPSPPPHLRTAVVSRVNIMAELDIAERRLPQDGRIRLGMRDRNVDVRVSTLPALHGESVVLRLLDKDGGRIALEDIGMDGSASGQVRPRLRPMRTGRRDVHHADQVHAVLGVVVDEALGPRRKPAHADRACMSDSRHGRTASGRPRTAAFDTVNRLH
jgi:hypothetical protein